MSPAHHCTLHSRAGLSALEGRWWGVLTPSVAAIDPADFWFSQKQNLKAALASHLLGAGVRLQWMGWAASRPL